jgi:hypothetical protein
MKKIADKTAIRIGVSLGLGGILAFALSLIVNQPGSYESRTFMGGIDGLLGLPITISCSLLDWIDPQGARDDSHLICLVVGGYLIPFYYAFFIFVTWTGIASLFRWIKKRNRVFS